MIQSDMVKGCLPRIQKQMYVALNARSQQLNKLPKGVKTSSDARAVFYQILNSIVTTLSQIVREGNFAEIPDDAQLRYTARLHERFQEFADDLHEEATKFRDESLTEEIRALLVEHQGVALPDFLPHPVLHYLMRKQIKSITHTCTLLVDETFEYATDVVLRIITSCGQGYPSLVKLCNQIATEALGEVKNSTVAFVEKMLEKESTIIFTTNDYYTATLEKMNAALGETKRHGGFFTAPVEQRGYTVTTLSAPCVALGAVADKISLQEIYNKDQKFQDAWRMKVSAAAYWKVVQKRLADEIPLEIRFVLQRAIVNDLHHKMMNHPCSTGGDDDLRALMEEDAISASNRFRLQRRVDALKNCLHLLSGLMH